MTGRRPALTIQLVVILAVAASAALARNAKAAAARVNFILTRKGVAVISQSGFEADASQEYSLVEHRRLNLRVVGGGVSR